MVFSAHEFHGCSDLSHFLLSLSLSPSSFYPQIFAEYLPWLDNMIGLIRDDKEDSCLRRLTVYWSEMKCAHQQPYRKLNREESIREAHIKHYGIVTCTLNKLDMWYVITKQFCFASQYPFNIYSRRMFFYPWIYTWTDPQLWWTRFSVIKSPMTR